MVALSDLLKLTKAQQRMAGALESAGRPLTYDELADAMAYQGDEPRKIVNVQLCLARKAWPDLPIVAVRGIGARWDG